MQAYCTDYSATKGTAWKKQSSETNYIGYSVSVLQGTVDEQPNGYYRATSEKAVLAAYYYYHASGTAYDNEGVSHGTWSVNATVGPYYIILASAAAAPKTQLPAPPLLCSAVDTSKVSITLPTVPNATGYTLQYADNSSFTSATSKSVSAGTTTITGLTADKTYYFRAKATTSSDSYTSSGYSSAYSCKTFKSPPVLVSAIAQDATTIKIEYQTTPF